MKRWISLLLAAAMILAMTGCGRIHENSEIDDLMDGITVKPVKDTDVAADAPGMLDFFLALSRKTSGDGNMLVSPLSVLAALAMTANGAKGETLAQMEAVLGMEVAQLNSWMHSYLESLPESKENRLNLANSIWFTADKRFTPVESFLQTNADYYGAGIYQAPFNDATLAAINNWVAAHTNNMVKNILDKIPEYAVMYLVNALAFEALWPTAYEEHQVREAVFTMTDGTERTVQMMHSEEMDYLEDECATGFVKYYKGGDYAFVALLPKEGITPGEYLQEVTGEGLYAMLAEPKEVMVFAAIPKFEMTYSVEMSDVLKSLGMVDAFYGDTADFTGLGTSTVGNIYISRVLHKTAITVAEQGTKAGAATVVEMRAEGATEIGDYREVSLDRPFVYMLIDCKNNLPFFIGTMEDPNQTENKAKEKAVITEELLKEPPKLVLQCGEKTADVGASSFNWDYYISEDERSGAIGCGAHPLQFKSYPTLQPESSEVLLDFTATPENWSVTCWSAEYLGQTEASVTAVTLTENGFLLNEGDFIYMISASWDTPLYSGTAEYVFRIEN